MVVELRGKNSRCASTSPDCTYFCSPRSTFDLVRLRQRSNFREKWHFYIYTPIAPYVCVVAIWTLHQRVPRLILNKIVWCYCIPLQHLAYVVPGAPPLRWKWGGRGPGGSESRIFVRGNPYQKPKTQRIWPTIFLKMGGLSPALSKMGGTRPPPSPLWRSPCVVLLSWAALPSLAVIAVTVKIQIGRMTMIDLGDGKEVVWGRFFGTMNHKFRFSTSGKSTKHMPIGYWSLWGQQVNRGQWP